MPFRKQEPRLDALEARVARLECRAALQAENQTTAKSDPSLSNLLERLERSKKQVADLVKANPLDPLDPVDRQ